jgi:Anti-sigma-K factor rskA, C-terminal
MTDTPDFRDLVGDDLTPEERERLERVHDLLVEAGPPPELPPALLEPSRQLDAPVVQLPRRRIGAVIALAAALALVAFLGGYLAGQNDSQKFSVVHSQPMHGVGAGRAASGTIDLGKLDSEGNWPLQLVVHHLPPAPKNGYYEMFLTRNGKIAATCGTFVVKGTSATVRLNAPYNLRRFDGWVVTMERPGTPAHEVLLST